MNNSLYLGQFYTVRVLSYHDLLNTAYCELRSKNNKSIINIFLIRKDDKSIKIKLPPSSLKEPFNYSFDDYEVYINYVTFEEEELNKKENKGE